MPAKKIKDRGKKKNLTVAFLVVIGVLLIGAGLGISIDKYLTNGPEITGRIPNNVQTVDLREFDLNNGNVAVVTIPAVNNKGQGVSTTLTVTAVKGTGKTLVDIDDLFFWADTQNSIRLAKDVAGNYSNLSLDNYDLIYNVQANANLISGPSGGAALAIATIAAINGFELREDVMMTGSINHDGTIGPVGGVLEKANAARDLGATLFLVPLAQGAEITYITREHCREFGFSTICNIEQVPRKVNVEEEVGINIVEVIDVGEALEHFRK